MKKRILSAVMSIVMVAALVATMAVSVGAADMQKVDFDLNKITGEIRIWLGDDNVTKMGVADVTVVNGVVNIQDPDGYDELRGFDIEGKMVGSMDHYVMTMKILSTSGRIGVGIIRDTEADLRESTLCFYGGLTQKDGSGVRLRGGWRRDNLTPNTDFDFTNAAVDADGYMTYKVEAIGNGANDSTAALNYTLSYLNANNEWTLMQEHTMYDYESYQLGIYYHVGNAGANIFFKDIELTYAPVAAAETTPEETTPAATPEATTPAATTPSSTTPAATTPSSTTPAATIAASEKSGCGSTVALSALAIALVPAVCVIRKKED